MSQNQKFSRIKQACLEYFGKSNDSGVILPHFSIFHSYSCSNLETFTYHPIICLILQGSKIVTLGDRRFVLQEGDALLVSHDLPITVNITRASLDKPFLAAIIDLDMMIIRSLYSQMGKYSKEETQYALKADTPDPLWLKPFERYLDLINHKLDTEILGAAVYREIHYRLLQSPIGGSLRSLLSSNSKSSRISDALAHLQSNYTETLEVNELASTAAMSTSAFYDSFKTITGTTPLQYQKELRLAKAKSMLDDGNHSVSDICFSIGYKSLSHFSRDYKRKFGLSPRNFTN